MKTEIIEIVELTKSTDEIKRETPKSIRKTKNNLNRYAAEKPEVFRELNEGKLPEINLRGRGNINT